jgi:hypothetical protein
MQTRQDRRPFQSGTFRRLPIALKIGVAVLALAQLAAMAGAIIFAAT